MSHPIEFPRVAPARADYTVHEISVQAILTCRCTPGGRVLVIRDHRMATICPGCQRQYLVGKVEYDFTTGAPLAAAVGFKEPAVVVPRVDLS